MSVGIGPTVKVAYQARHQMNGLTVRQIDEIERTLISVAVQEADGTQYRSVEEIGAYRVLWEKDGFGDPLILAVVTRA